MEKKLEFTTQAKDQIKKITESAEKNILEYQCLVVDAQDLNTISV